MTTTTRQVKTTCTRDCPDACGIVATTDGERILRIRGDQEHPYTSGFLCWRTNQYLDRVYNPQRLTQPLRRGGHGRLVEISVEEAVAYVGELIRNTVRDHSAAAIFHVGGGGSLGLLKMCWSALLTRVGSITATRGGICAGAGYEALARDYGGRDSPDPHDVMNARQVLLWGKNPYVASPHMIPMVNGARKNGARVLCVDPLHTRAVELADRSFHPAPGSDAVLALCILRAAFERGCIRPDAETRVVGLETLRALVMQGDVEAWRRRIDLPREELDALVGGVLETRPTAWVVGWGLQRRSLGGTALRLLSAAAYLLGDVGVAGGGFHFAYTRKRGLDCTWSAGHAPARTVPEGQAGRALRELGDPRVQLLFVDNANPVTQHGNSRQTAEAVAQTPHVVVTDAFLTDTAELAEVVLPASTMLEEDDLVGSYGQPYLGLTQQVVPPPGNARSDLEWCRLIAPHVGVDPSLFDARKLTDQMLGSMREHGVDRERLRQGAVKNPLASRSGVAFEGGVTFHPDGKFHVVTELPEEPPADPAFPLWLMSVSKRERQSSQILDEAAGPQDAILHPDVAAQHELHDGAAARLVSAQGHLDVVIRTDARQRRDVVQCHKGGWVKLGKAVNVLTSDAITDMGDGAAYYDTRVRLERR
ncbi:MAG: molybdopterin-dependent oxidoreductase [Myxococcota bacterium]